MDWDALEPHQQERWLAASYDKEDKNNNLGTRGFRELQIAIMDDLESRTNYSRKPVAENGGSIPNEQQLSEATITQIFEERLAQFGHQAPVVVSDSEAAVLGDRALNDGAVASGMTYQGKIHLFRDGLRDSASVTRTLWHELLHYGLRRFLPKAQYIAQMTRLYTRDAWVRAKANQWTATPEGKEVAAEYGESYARARGVDEALAQLSEILQGEYQNNNVIAKAIRAVARWVAAMAEKYGFPEVAARWRAVTNDEARTLIASVFAKLKEDAPATFSDGKFMSDPTFQTERGEQPMYRRTGTSAYEEPTGKAAEIKQQIGLAVKAISDEYGPKQLSLHGLVEVFKDAIPSLQTYYNRVSEMEAMQTKMQVEGHKVATAWRNLDKGDRTKLDSVTVDATMLGIHPDVRSVNDPRNVHVSDQHRGKIAGLVMRFRALSPEAKEVYQQAQKKLEADWKLRAESFSAAVSKSYESLLAKETDAAKHVELTKERDKLLARHEKKLAEHKGPYFPLLRHGPYIAVMKSKALVALEAQVAETPNKEDQAKLTRMKTDPKHYAVEAFESQRLAEYRASQAQKDWASVTTKLADEYDTADRSGSTIGLKRVEDYLSTHMAPEDAQKIRRMMAEVQVSMLPENSALSRALHRKGIAGASSDMLRSFSTVVEKNAVRRQLG